uniref:Uncharacterized protein n=1 Tax=Anguilla anguilla TaxID=7936 RepID=A0A0E9XFF8_ANGAN
MAKQNAARKTALFLFCFFQHVLKVINCPFNPFFLLQP